MEYPKIQTDNFYKFLTLAGAFLILFSNTYFLNKRYETTIEIAKLTKDKKISIEKLKEFDKRANDELDRVIKILSIGPKINEKQNANTIKKVQESDKTSNENKKIERELEIEKLENRLLNPLGKNRFQLEAERKIEDIEFEYKVKIIKYKLGELNFWIIIFYLGQIIGFPLLFFGVVKWIKTQNIQDEILYYQLQIIKKENPYLIEEKKKTDGKKKKGIMRIKNGKQ